MGRGSIEIEWAGCACSGAFHEVEVDHGGGDVGMTEKTLNRSNVGYGYQEMGGEGVPQGVGGDPLRDTGFPDRITKSGHRAGDCHLLQPRSPGDPRVSNQACVRRWSAVPWR